MAPSRATPWLVSRVWQNPQVASAPAVGLRPSSDGRHQRTTVYAGGGIGEAGRHPVDRGRTVAALADGVGERHQIVLVGMRRQRPCVTHQLPATRRGDPAGVCDTQIPGMRLGHRGQRPDDGCRVRVHERQRRDRIVGTPGPTAATGNIHEREVIVRKRGKPPDTRSYRSPDLQPLLFGCGRAQITRITPRPGDARSAAPTDRSGLAQSRRTVRHGGAGGL